MSSSSTGSRVGVAPSSASTIACKYVLCKFGQHAAAASAAALSCKSPEILLVKEKSEFLWFSSGLLVFREWKTGVLEFVDSFSQFGKEKGKRFTLPKMSSHRDGLHASTLVNPGDFVKIKGWDGHKHRR